jgi:hypothetical protein
MHLLLLEAPHPIKERENISQQHVVLRFLWSLELVSTDFARHAGRPPTSPKFVTRHINRSMMNGGSIPDGGTVEPRLVLHHSLILKLIDPLFSGCIISFKFCYSHVPAATLIDHRVLPRVECR